MITHFSNIYKQGVENLEKTTNIEDDNQMQKNPLFLRSRQRRTTSYFRKPKKVVRKDDEGKDG